jgi:hypothetical protein
VKGNILVVYALRQYPVRDTVRDHLYSFARYSRHRCFYLNAAVRDVPRLALTRPFDAVVFHNSFLSHRWAPEAYRELLERSAPLKGIGRIRMAIVQDEFLRSDLVSEFIEDFGIGHVLTSAPQSEVPLIYEKVDRERVRFTTVLTGYLEPRSVKRAEHAAAPAPERTLDVGYRAWHAAPWLGRHGLLKTEVAEAFQREAPGHGLEVDISTRNEDTLYGNDWYRFLGSCRYTIGVEGGASLLDRDGSIKEGTERYLEEHPGASFDQVERACFRGEDGELRLYAISPRHLEACATRTCQVLVEGEYNGVLRAGEHYIPLRRDLGNLDEVIGAMRNEDDRVRMAEAAYRDVVASGAYTYRRFVEQVEAAASIEPSGDSLRLRIAHPAARARDRLTWVGLWGRLGLATRTRAGLVTAAKRLLPARVVEWIRRRRAPAPSR